MRAILARSGLAAGLAVILVAVLAGISSGSAGHPLIIGGTNHAGTTNTSMDTTSGGNAFVMYQHGSGSALRGWAFGVGNGVSATSSNKNGNGVFSENVATSFDQNNPGVGIVGTGDHTWGVVGATFDVNAPGVQGEDDSQSATGTGVTGLTDSGDGVTGVALTHDTASMSYGGVFGTAADNASASAVLALGCAAFNGTGCVSDSAGQFQGDVTVTGNLTVNGTCTGCALSVLAVNAGGSTIRRGDAVTVAGVRAGAGTSTLLLVAPAAAGQMVVGIADTEMSPRSQVLRRPIPAHYGRYKALRPGTLTQTTYVAGGPAIAPNRYLRVITGGIVMIASADASAGAIRVGDSLGASSAAGRLALARPVSFAGRSFVLPGTSIGYALGTLAAGSGSIAVYVSPH